MEMINKIVEQLQDFAKLQDVLILIKHKMEGHEINFPLPTFNDNWIEQMVSSILEGEEE